jgi:hypothetical protein
MFYFAKVTVFLNKQNKNWRYVFLTLDLPLNIILFTEENVLKDITHSLNSNFLVITKKSTLLS